MADIPFDTRERFALCDLFKELGADASTLIEGWTAQDLAAHIVLRERDPIAGPCIILPGPFQRFAERRRVRLARQREFGWLVARIRSGPPPGLFRIGWVRSFPNLNEFFVHHEDVRRANGLGPPRATAACRASVFGRQRGCAWRSGRQAARRYDQDPLRIWVIGKRDP